MDANCRRQLESISQGATKLSLDNCGTSFSQSAARNQSQTTPDSKRRHSAFSVAQPVHSHAKHCTGSALFSRAFWVALKFAWREIFPSRNSSDWPKYFPRVCPRAAKWRFAPEMAAKNAQEESPALSMARPV